MSYSRWLFSRGRNLTRHRHTNHSRGEFSFGLHCSQLVANEPQIENVSLPLTMLPSDNRYRLSFYCQQASERDVFKTVPSIYCRSLASEYFCTKVDDRNTYHGSKAAWNCILFVCLYPAMLLHTFSWLQYTNNSCGSSLGDRFTWGICLGSTWKGPFSRER